MLITIQNALEQKAWYRNSSGEIKGKLHDLYESGYAGFVTYLASFPDYFDNIEIIRLEKIAKARFSLVAPVFAVLKDSKEYTYEFASWKMGPNAGAKGVLFLRRNTQEVTHFVLLKTSKFALGGKKTHGCIGGFAETFDSTITECILREISEEVGEVGVPEIIDLGKVYPDHGMICSHITVFAAFVGYVPGTCTRNLDTYEMPSSIEVLPINQLDDFVMKNDDGLFLSVIARAKTQGLI